MNKSIAGLLIFAGIIGLWSSCTYRGNWHPSAGKLQSDIIGTVGHGAIKDNKGKELKVDEKLIARVQKIYLSHLTSPALAVREGGRLDRQRIALTQKQIFSTVGDRILANALFIEWLIEQRKPQNEAQYSIVNNALRWFYVLNLQTNAVLPDAKSRWGKGLKDEEAAKLEDSGIKVYSLTTKGMPEYCDECLEAGVPVPRNMFGEEWTILGTFDGEEFISPESFPELMIYVSQNPEGFCLALPRYEKGSGGSAPDGSSAKLFGVICLGTRTSKACFFDNPQGRLFKKNQVIDFKSNFIGGTDLVLNGQGICTDCHAGENPYVIHPDKAAFNAILTKVSSTVPATWHDPLVHATWPQNPGPTYLLDAVASPGQCNACHQQGSAGRFPDMSYPLPGYCGSVFQNTVRAPSSGGTMPRPPFVAANFTAHINALNGLCGTQRFPGKIEPGSQTPDPSFISKPIVLGPLYACATAVSVRGVVLDAKASLLIDGAVVATIDPARSPFKIEFQGLPALTAGQVVTAIQQSGCDPPSAPSDPVTVKNYTEDYPGGLPKPVIDPTTVYECAELIAVRHVPGATLTVLNNGANPRSFISSWNWTAIPPAGAPFKLNDEFTVTQSLCTDNSAPSDAVKARTPPGSMPTPTFRPPNFINGQELLFMENIVEGAKVTLREATTPWTGSFSTPINWIPDYDIKSALGRPLRSGDSIATRQGLCDTTGEWSPDQKVHDCEQLPAPLIETPIAGNTFVIVAQSQPGARVMIYDSGGTEIGDGSGTVVPLKRAIVAGEVLTAVQRVGECTGRFVYRVRAARGK